jgi:AGCS family alanine or glycine:cation symporter
MIGPVIDTMIVCMMTAFVIIVTGVWENTDLAARSADLDTTLKGVLLTSEAFGSVIPWFPYVLTVCIVLFAYSTMISWCYYGERGWIYLIDSFGGNGLKSVIVFRIIFVMFVLIGAVNRLGDVMDFSDVMILSMALPNIAGSIILAPKVYAKLTDYWGRLQAGEMPEN